MLHRRSTRVLIAVILAVLFFALWGAVNVRAACEVEPASQWAPQGYVCPPMYGEGTASTWAGPGVARNDCTYPWVDCAPIRITSLDTGLSVVVTPTMYCMCWVGVTGPAGETERIVDLDPPTRAALGIPDPGLYPVLVEPFTEGSLGPVLPDTAMKTPIPWVLVVGIFALVLGVLVAMLYVAKRIRW